VGSAERGHARGDHEGGERDQGEEHEGFHATQRTSFACASVAEGLDGYTPTGYKNLMAKRSTSPTPRRRPTALLAALAAVVVVGGLGVALTRGSDAALTTVTVRDLYAANGQDPVPTVLDVREPDEYAAGHVQGALLMPLARTVEMATAAGLPKDEPVYVFCRSGNRSLQAAQALVAAGYLDVRNVDGGILAWNAAGLPVVR
jgi:rhodanese-related sulfurtransferase